MLGYGIFNTRGFRQGDMLPEYKGDLVTPEVADGSWMTYEKEGKGCFIYDVEHKGNIMW